MVETILCKREGNQLTSSKQVILNLSFLSKKTNKTNETNEHPKRLPPKKSLDTFTGSVGFIGFEQEKEDYSEDMI